MIQLKKVYDKNNDKGKIDTTIDVAEYLSKLGDLTATEIYTDNDNIEQEIYNKKI